MWGVRGGEGVALFLLDKWWVLQCSVEEGVCSVEDMCVCVLCSPEEWWWAAMLCRGGGSAKCCSLLQCSECDCMVLSGLVSDTPVGCLLLSSGGASLVA